MAIVGIVGAAQTLVILTAGIDLSVGAIMVLSSVVMGQFTFRYGIPAPISILCGFAVGALCGYVNGFLVAQMKLPPFIVTLGTWQIVLADQLPLFRATRRSAARTSRPRRRCCSSSASRSRSAARSSRSASIVMVLLVLVLWYVLNHTAWGRHVYAIGDDPDAAELSGVRGQQDADLGLHALGPHLRAGRLGADRPHRLGVADLGRSSPTSSRITAVVIGGISLFGGRGSILGMMFGALIVGVFALGLRLLGTDPQWTYLPDRRAHHRRGRDRPVDQKGGGLTSWPNPFSPHAAWSSAMAASPRSTTPTST